MIRGFESIFGDAKQVHIVVSEEAATYRPEMEWLAAQLGASFTVHDSRFNGFADGSTVYRFFELFDLANVANWKKILELAVAGKIRLTPPPKPHSRRKCCSRFLEPEPAKLLAAGIGRGFSGAAEKGDSLHWLVDPTPLPPHAAIPELNLTDWQQLKTLSQKERDLILKVSGFSEHAWGARGVFLGSDLSHADWSAAVDRAISSFDASPFVLQRYEKPSFGRGAMV